MSLIHHLVQRAARQRLSDLRALVEQPALAQAWTLARILERAGRTRFGHDHGLERVRTHAEFRRAVPLRQPHALDPWWSRARRGEEDAIWPGHVARWEPLGRGPVPLTAAGLRSARASGWDAFAPVLAGMRRDVREGCILLLGSTQPLPRRGALWTSGGSHPSTLHLPPALARRARTTSSDRDGGDVHGVRSCIGRDVRVILGKPAHVDRFAADLLAHGRRLGLGHRSLPELWPDLEILDVGPDLRRAAPRVDGGARRPNRRQILSVLEVGAVAMQDRLDDPGLLPIPDRGVFFEFVPHGEEEGTAPRRLGLHEVEPDTDYAVAVTTNNGAYACLTGYVVRFPDVTSRRLVVVGRPVESRRGDHPAALSA